MSVTTTSSNGVQDLIDRIRSEGVQAARDESERILREARQLSQEIVAQARAEADAERAKARAEIQAHRAASLEALQLAARDTVLDLKSRVISRFEEFLKRLVVSATQDKELIRNIVLVVAGQATSQFINDKQVEVRISQALWNGQTEPVFKEEGKQAILGLSSEMLRAGVDLAPAGDIEGGARVRLVDDKLEIDLSDRAVSRMIAQRLLPRFKAILDGAE